MQWTVVEVLVEWRGVGWMMLEETTQCLVFNLDRCRWSAGGTPDGEAASTESGSRIFENVILQNIRTIPRDMSSTFYHPTPLFPAVDVCTITCLCYLSITWNISRSKLESWRRFLGSFPDVYEKSSRYRCMMFGSGCDFKTQELPLIQLLTQCLNQEVIP